MLGGQSAKYATIEQYAEDLADVCNQLNIQKAIIIGHSMGGMVAVEFAAGGIMDGAVLHLGAGAAQLGTAFVATPESAADEGYRATLASGAAHNTVMTADISGRPARCLANRFTALVADVSAREIPAYPVAYDAGKALNAAAKAKGEPSYGAQWAARVRHWRARSLWPS